MEKSNQVRWWENEPFLAYEQVMATMPGFTFSNRWQDTTDPSIETEHIKASNALQTHGVSFMDGHLNNSFCYFKSGSFKEEREDYLRSYLVSSKKAGFRTIVYFNVHAIKPEFGNECPQWKQLRFDRSEINDLYGLETAFCVNSPWRDWVRDTCLDLCKYPIDGIFFDGPCLFANACYCDHCTKLYKERYGEEMPPKEPGHPKLRQLASFQSESLRLFFEHCNNAIKKARPDVALYGNSGSREEPYYAVARNNRVLMKSQDILLAEGGFVYGALSNIPVWKQGSNAKYYQTQAHGKPSAVANSPAHGPWRSYYQTETELMLSCIQPPIQGSGIWFSAFNWFKDQPAFSKISWLYKHFSDNRDKYFNTVSKAKTAIVWPEDSINFYAKPTVSHGDFTQGGRQGEKTGDISEEFNGFYDALIKSHIPCDIIDEESIRSEDISKYSLIILPNVACTGADFDARLKEYVKNGGNVIASFETSICDADGKRDEELSLSDLFGIKMQNTPVKPFPHFYFFKQTDWPDLFSEITVDRLPSPLISTEIALAGAKTASPYSIKFKGWDGSQILPSDHPAISINEYGKGKAVYLAGVFGSLYWNYKQSDIRKLLNNLYNMLCPQDVCAIDLASSIELTHRQSIDGKYEMISLINYTGGLTRPFEKIQTQNDITICVKTQKNSTEALVGKVKLHTKKVDDKLYITLPKLELFETIVLEEKED